LKKHDTQGQIQRTRVELESGPAQQAEGFSTTLTPLEEKVIRMLHGLSEGDDKVLEYAVGASEDARARMALMEAYSIAELDGVCPIAEDAPLAVLDGVVERFHDE